MTAEDATAARCATGRQSVGSPASRVNGARRARNGRSERPIPSCIGLIGETVLAATFAGLLIDGARRAAAEYESVLMLANTSGDPDLADWDIRALVDRRVAGIVYAAEHPRIIVPPSALQRVPHVLVNCVEKRACARTVVADQAGGAGVAVTELMNHGHRRIGYLHGRSDDLAATHRLTGYRWAMSDSGYYEPALTVADEPGGAGGYRAAMKILQRPDPPTALLCFNDRMAIGAYQAANTLHVTIPAELSVVAFADVDLIAQGLSPTLTTVQLPHQQMGRWAVYTLMHLIGLDRTQPIEHLALPCEINRRQSVAAPRPR